MGEVVPARTSLTLHPPFPPTVLSVSCFKGVPSASIVVTSTLRVKLLHKNHLNEWTLSVVEESYMQ